MELYTPRYMMIDPVYGQILYNSCLSNAFQLKLEQDCQLVLVEMKTATRKGSVEQVIRPAKVIPASFVTVQLCPTANQ